jgi:tyrosine-protein phosphatase SIW14
MHVLSILLLLQVVVTSPPKNQIARFQKVADGLYRGAQPERVGFEYLKTNGIKTIINLRMENDEEPVVRNLGMNYIHIPINDMKPWSKIPESAIDQYFKVLEDPANYPIFFHCQRGADRTGAMAGFYRISMQGWEPTKAYSEARDIGMRWYFGGLKQQLHSFKRPPTKGAVAPAVAPTVTN